MCCLYSLAAVMPYMNKEQIANQIVPIFVKACRDDIPNVKFCVARIIHQQRQYIDTNVFSSQLLGHLKDLQQDADRDVAYFANIALQAS